MGAPQRIVLVGELSRMMREHSLQDQGFLYDINGENAVAPKKIATIPFQKWCPDLQWRYGGFNVHPSGDYIYAAQGLRSDICGDYDGDGVAGDYVQEIMTSATHITRSLSR